MAYTETSLFQRTLAEPPGQDKDAAPRKRLRDALSGLRARAAVLAGEIDRDLPGLTVHDITHLDALWEMADLIAGPDYPLNPLEAFTLGGAFLLHDLGLGLAAWPGGRAELQKGAGWQDALSAHLREQLGRPPTPEELASPPPEVEKAAIEERLRLLHAERAGQLAFATWFDLKGGMDYHLIDDPDLRQALGSLLGRIAHSHWWPVSRLSSEFGTVVGALPDCPTSWEIDPLKVAVLLRTADAAHLDARRAPGFLRALRHPEETSRDHWLFQEHMLKPRLEAERLVYTTARPFPVEEVDAWWLCEEAVRNVDHELHKVDSLLSDLKRPRLQARGVTGADSPGRLREYVKVTGWTPIDARIHVSSVAELARRLGGEQLYGDEPYVPLRELIQNAADAVRARRLLESRDDDWGAVTVRLGEDEQGWWIEVADTGIGMSEAVVTGPLLDFGTTYWGSMLMREEHEGLWAKGFEPTGRFGIGFFSVFMWGHRVRVSTRPYQEARRSTQVLEFKTGLEVRPLFRPANREEWLPDGGTTVRVWLSIDPYQNDGLLFDGEDKPALDLAKLCAWLAPALDVDLYVDDGTRADRILGASDWFTLEPVELLKRVIYIDREALPHLEDLASRMRLLHDSNGQIMGRASITPVSSLSFFGSSPSVVTAGGLRTEGGGLFAGILVGSTERAARDWAQPIASDATLAAWASDQAKLVYEMVRDPDQQVRFTTSVLWFGGDPCELPIAIRDDQFIDRLTLTGWHDAPDEVIIVTATQLRRTLEGVGGDRAVVWREVVGDKSDLAVVGDLTRQLGVRLHRHVLIISEEEWFSVVPIPFGQSLRDSFYEAYSEAWGCSPEDLLISEVRNVEVGLQHDLPYTIKEASAVCKPQPRAN